QGRSRPRHPGARIVRGSSPSVPALHRIAPSLTLPHSPRRRTQPRAERLLPLAHLPVLVLQHLVDVEQPQRVQRGEHGELEEGVVGPRVYRHERRWGGGTKGWVYAQDGQSLLATALARAQVGKSFHVFLFFHSTFSSSSRSGRESISIWESLPDSQVLLRACAVMRLCTGRFGRLVWYPLGIAARFDDAGGGVFRVSVFGCGRCYEARPGWCPGMRVPGARVWACVDDVPAFVRCAVGNPSCVVRRHCPEQFSPYPSLISASHHHTTDCSHPLHRHPRVDGSRLSPVHAHRARGISWFRDAPAAPPGVHKQAAGKH
ncbi:hypothetical protein B0H10DRAFT_2305406, partial [Mycena sp. CBHHK59/15]